MSFINVTVAVADGGVQHLVGDAIAFDKGNGVGSDLFQDVFDGIVDIR